MNYYRTKKPAQRAGLKSNVKNGRPAYAIFELISDGFKGIIHSSTLKFNTITYISLIYKQYIKYKYF
jgi:hypothetical protein